ncbi:hypothetical protein DFP94_102456 [Fontibacillus phaseoli]|uniref:DUF309 domain-containing protein n=1 Tax=Fontibacillus phaseoli TaxID=1416533 RepID=A0A369BJC1_9BACL|nr:DUF309 domain-containing protein [Fontibacillus phaseoli]RCX21700.1 hypothetical protein DFP94_102456 [Fontibacillus phaseoli]
MSYEPLYVAYLIYFNRDRDYFECHEVLEELWLKQGRSPLYKGLLQVAVGLYHFRNGNVTGGRKMLASAGDKLAAYPPDSLGIDLERLRHETSAYANRLENFEQEPFGYYDLNIELIDPELISAVEKSSPDIVPNIPQQRGPRRGAKHEAREAKADKRRE